MDDFIAVIVLYKTEVAACATLITLNAALKKTGHTLDLIIYDNSPLYNQHLITECYENFKVTYIADGENPGVSKAYNTGYNTAVKRNKKWILLFDQDTMLPENTIVEYLSAIDHYPGIHLFAPVMLTNMDQIISPANFKYMRGSYSEKVEYGINNLKGHSLINSGLCISVKKFGENNGYNNLIKLDFSDHDFIKRFEKNISDQYVVIKLRILHQLSTSTKNAIDTDIIRFNYYLEGASFFSVGKTDAVFLKIVTLLRSIKLSAKHKSFYFVRKYFNLIS